MRPHRAVVLLREFLIASKAGLLKKLGIELRFYCANGKELAIGAFVDLVVMGARVEHVDAALIAPETHCHKPVHKGCEHCGAVNHGCVDDLALARQTRFDDAARNAKRKQHAATTEVANEIERRLRTFIGTTDCSKRATNGDVVHVMAGHLRHGAVLTPTSHAPIDEFRIASQTRIGSNAQSFGHTGTKTFNKCIGLLDKTKHRLNAPGVLEIDTDGPTSTVHDVLRRRGGIAAVHLPGTIDTDDVGTHIGQHHRRERPWPNSCNLNDANARERSHNCAPKGGKKSGYALARAASAVTCSMMVAQY